MTRTLALLAALCLGVSLGYGAGYSWRYRPALDCWLMGATTEDTMRLAAERLAACESRLAEHYGVVLCPCESQGKGEAKP